MKTKTLSLLCLFAALSAQATNFDFNSGTQTWAQREAALGATTTSADQMRLSGTAILNVTDGLTHVIGNFEHNSATINLTGTGSRIQAGDLVLGASNTNQFQMTIGTGAVLEFTGINGTGTNKRFEIGRDGATATVDLDGGLITGSVNDMLIELGNRNPNTSSGKATLNITNGGIIQTTSTTVDEVTTNYNLRYKLSASENGNSEINISDAGSKMYVSNLTSTGTALTMAGGASSKAVINVASGGSLIFERAEYNMVIAMGTGSVNSTSEININNGGNVRFTGTGSSARTIEFSVGSNVDASFNLNSGSTMTVDGTSGTEFRVGAGTSGGTMNFNLDGTTLTSNQTGGDLNFVLAYGAGLTGIMNVSDGTKIFQVGNNIQFSVGYNASGYGELNITGSSEIRTGGNFDVGATNSGSTLSGYMLLDNSKIIGKDGSSNAGDLRISSVKAGRSNAKGKIDIINGSDAYFREILISNAGGTGEGDLIIKGKGTNVRSASGITIGTSVDGSTGYGKVSVYSGATFRNQGNSFTINNTGTLTLMLDSSEIPTSENIAMAFGKDLVITHDGGLVIDGSLLNDVMVPGENDYTVLLWDFNGNGGKITLKDAAVLTVGTDSDALILDALANFISFQNNTDIATWEDFSKDDLSFANGKLTLLLHSIPEPSTYAAIFGALALAFAVYRRKR